MRHAARTGILLVVIATVYVLQRWYAATSPTALAPTTTAVASAQQQPAVDDVLRLDQIAALVTSTAGKNGLFLRSRIIPAARTWMRNLSSYDRVYVLLEDTFAVRFMLRHCVRREGPRNTYFACPENEPVYVLTRRCTEEYYAAASACCKVEEGLAFLLAAQPHVLKRLQFLLVGDDDTFWRVDQVHYTTRASERALPAVPSSLVLPYRRTGGSLVCTRPASTTSPSRPTCRAPAPCSTAPRRVACSTSTAAARWSPTAGTRYV
jgi:hypothetical protein